MALRFGFKVVQGQMQGQIRRGVGLAPPPPLPHETHGLPQAIITGQLAQCHVADGAILHIYRQHRPRPEGCFVYGVVVPFIVYL